MSRPAAANPGQQRPPRPRAERRWRRGAHGRPDAGAKTPCSAEAEACSARCVRYTNREAWRRPQCAPKGKEWGSSHSAAVTHPSRQRGRLTAAIAVETSPPIPTTLPTNPRSGPASPRHKTNPATQQQRRGWGRAPRTRVRASWAPCCPPAASAAGWVSGGPGPGQCVRRQQP